MRLCCNCFEELLDREVVCPICNSNTTLDSNQTKEFYHLVKEVKTANKLKLLSLKNNSKYEIVFKYIEYRKENPKNNESGYPKILDLAYKKDDNESQEEYWSRINQHTINKTELQDTIPKCPTCGSTNISKISTLNRAVSVGVFGLASSKIGKTHKCNKCGSTW